MKQLTSFDQPRVDMWYIKAINCPTVRPYLQHTQYTEELKVPTSDWGEVFFMDDLSTTLLRLGLDRQRHSASVRLYSLPNSEKEVTKAIRLLIKLHKVYGIKAYTFMIHQSNKKWLNAIQKRFLDYCWGKEPEGAYDMSIGEWVPVYHFSVPVDNLTSSKVKHNLKLLKEQNL